MEEVTTKMSREKYDASMKKFVGAHPQHFTDRLVLANTTKLPTRIAAML
jgi:hypothetical protein